MFKIYFMLSVDIVLVSKFENRRIANVLLTKKLNLMVMQALAR